MRKREVSLSDVNNDANLEYLYRAFMALDNVDECRYFLGDLCTQAELLEMARRLRAAKMLQENYPYSEICLQTGLSSATVSRVNRCLKFGHDYGYYTILKRLQRPKTL